MISRKPAILLCTSNGLHSLTGPSLQSPISNHELHGRSDRERRAPRQKRRGHASMAGEPGAGMNDDIPWLELSQSRRRPTPYDIFNQRRNEPYSKLRFYQLVKLYHPDRYAYTTATCSRAVMLERYRMIIAANSILSDPVKRRAYDTYGFGWSGTPEIDVHASDGSSSRRSGTQTYRWRHGFSNHQWASDPMSNATWEDWERWYHAQRSSHSSSSSAWGSFFTQQNAPQHPLLANKHALFSLVFLFAILGGIGNATRAKGWNKTRNQKAQLLHEETSKDLMATRQNALDRLESGKTKEARIARFLREKEGYAEGEVDGRVMREGDDEFCASGTTKDRSKLPFWQRPPER